MPRRERLRRHRSRKGRCRCLCSLRPAPLADAHFRHLVRQFHRLGPRPLAEFLAEIACERMLCSEIEARLEAYLARLDRSVLEALDGAELTVLRPRVQEATRSVSR